MTITVDPTLAFQIGFLVGLAIGGFIALVSMTFTLWFLK